MQHMFMKRISLMAVIALLFVQHTFAQSKMHFYFNRTVNTNVSTGVPADYTGSSMADTLMAYINMAKHTLDIAQYDYNQSGSFANIANAVNNAYNRGVVVRWIYDGSSSNNGLNTLNANIRTLASPTTRAYGIMHDKVVIIDANSANISDAWLLTGSPDWSSEMFTTDYNNMVAIQDAPLAKAYTDEFNMMWGGTDSIPNTANSKFGPYKTDLGEHNFIIDGHQVELYFSPSDNTDSHIQTTIQTANTDLYFGMYTFTEANDASQIVARKNAGVYVAGIDDVYSHSYAPYTTFTNGLGNNFIEYDGGRSSIYHNKYMIVDPSNTCSDPLVLTGSHNWTSSANNQNDENTLIIHSDTVANIYYQAFNADFTGLGGTLAAQPGCRTAVPQVNSADYKLSVYPNPSTAVFSLSYQLPGSQQVSVSVTDVTGRELAAGLPENTTENAGLHTVKIDVPAQGVYFWIFRAGSYTATGKLVRL